MPANGWRRGAACAAALAAVLAAPAAGRAAKGAAAGDAIAAGAPLDEARAAAAKLKYKLVVKYATEALAMPGNPHAALVEIYALLATAHATLGDPDKATDAFTRLLGIEPGYALPKGLSPKVTTPFREAGGYWIDHPGGITLAVDLARAAAGPGGMGATVAVPATLDDPLKMADRARLHWRHAGEAEFAVADAAAAPSMTFSVTGPAATLEVWLEAVDAHGGSLRTAGDARAPLVLVGAGAGTGTATGTGTGAGAVTGTGTGTGTGALVGTGTGAGAGAGAGAAAGGGGHSVLGRWWLWTIVGVVVLGGAGAAAYYFAGPAQGIDLSITATVGP
jgi:hypothetical protein